MNKRIKELAEQANGPNPFFGSLKGQMVLLGDNAVKKFAELIVKECAGLLEKEAKSSHDEGTETYNLLLNESKWMREHFGVEE